MSVTDFYELTLDLLDKTQSTPTKIATTGRVVDGNLLPFRHRVELLNTGNLDTDSGVLVLRIPPDGTFIRTEPILVDEGAKDEYIIEAQIKQPDGIGGTRNGKLHRFTIGRPTIQDDVHGGETLKLQLIPLEYRAKEHLQSRQLFFRTPNIAFIERINDYNTTKGSGEPALAATNINLPTVAKVNWEPRAPTRTHDLFRDIIERQAEANVAGGTFTDFYFDYETNAANTTIIDMTAEEVSNTASNVVINPLSVDTIDSEKDKSVNIDLVKFKNNVILQGHPTGGTLPMEKARFTSEFEHGKQRDEWDPASVSYAVGDLVRVTVTSSTGYIRFFTCTVAHTSSGALNPQTGGIANWREDFTVIPPWNTDAEYFVGDIVTHPVASNTEFYVCNTDTDLTDTSPNTSGKWTDLSIPYPTSQYTAFFSYTPWTSNLDAQKANLSGTGTLIQYPDWTSGLNYIIGNRVLESGLVYEATAIHTSAGGNQPPSSVWTLLSIPGTSHVGVVPDWNFVRSNFDRNQGDNQFENISFKSVVRAERTQANIPTEEIVNGARFLINGTGVGTDFTGNDNKIAEWFQPVGTAFGGGEWKFSDPPGANDEMVTDLNTGQIWRWNGSAPWTVTWSPDAGSWNPSTDNGKFSSPFHTVSDIRLTTGSTGVPGQAIRLKYNWNQLHHSMNLSSRGAWFIQHLPIPRRTFGASTEGELYANSVLDTRNLDRNRLGNFGWNNGLDSEDLGKISILNTKVRLDVRDKNNNLINQLANIPMTAWAVDIFDRIWFFPFTLRRNGQYSLVKIAFGENAPQNIHHNRIDELFTFYGFTFSQNFFLKEKEFTGIEFDWRFVRAWGMFWNIAYDDNGMYIGVRDHLKDSISQYLQQLGSWAFGGVVKLATGLQLDTVENLIIDSSCLDIDELAFEKQLYTNSDDTAVTTARTDIIHDTVERDYKNAKVKAQAGRARRKFINQAWFMKTLGDVRLRFGHRFNVLGSRVPIQPSTKALYSGITSYSVGDEVRYTISGLGEFAFRAKLANTGIAPDSATGRDNWENLNELWCNEARHIIDSDGYYVELSGLRKFLLT